MKPSKFFAKKLHCPKTVKMFSNVFKELDKNFISIKEHEKIVNKRQKVFLETSSKLANQMLGLKAKVRKELRKKVGKLFGNIDVDIMTVLKIIDEELE